MTDSINVHKVAQLARLKLTDQEEAYFSEKFEQILGYVGQLAEVSIEGNLAEKDESQQSLYREDQASDSGIQVGQVSDKIENNHFVVPSVIG